MSDWHDKGVNKWDLIFDFTKDENGSNEHYNLLEPSQFQIISKEIEGVEGKPVMPFPYP